MKMEWRERSSIFPDSRWVIWMKKSIVAAELKSFAIITFILYDKYIRWLKGGESMKTIDLFSQGLNDFSSLQKEDLSNVFILHGIVHWFMDEFDLGQQVFRDYLSESNPSLAISLTPKELILDAYERYLFVDESVWLSMLKDRYRPDCTEPVEAKVERITRYYVPAFESMIEALEN